MSLVLTIVKLPANLAMTESTQTFGEQGGTLGRADNNTWVLNDPERFLSSVHCQISFENGQFFLTDSSTNGTFINGLPEPIGRGSRSALKDGDVFDLGDYSFQVSLSGANAGIGIGEPAAQGFADEDPLGGPFGGGSGLDQAGFDRPAPALFDTPPVSSNVPFGDPFATGNVTDSPLVPDVLDETDPLVALDKAQQVSQPEVKADIFSTSKPGDAMSDSLHWPSAQPESGAIPDDWDDDFDLSPAQQVSAPSLPDREPVASIPPEPVVPASIPAANPRVSSGIVESTEAAEYKARNQLLEDANRQLRAELKGLKQELLASQASTGPSASSGSSQVDRSFLNALGLGDRGLDDQQIAEINQVAGELVRETVTGMMQVLSSRSSIKNEFRMNVTTIQPVENNPLKFSANIDDALENMFIKKGNAFKKPVDAVKEGFQGIAEHQIAILAGMRFAFKGVMDRFDPITLEKRFEKQNKSGLIGSQKAKNWSAYFEYYNELVNDMDKSFQYLFGDEFVQAYEEQLRKLSMSQKAQTHSSKTKDI